MHVTVEKYVLFTDVVESVRLFDIDADAADAALAALVNGDGEQRMELSGQVGFKYFGQLIRDCLDGTENAMTQDHVLKAAELCVRAQLQAEHLTA